MRENEKPMKDRRRIQPCRGNTSWYLLSVVPRADEKEYRRPVRHTKRFCPASVARRANSQMTPAGFAGPDRCRATETGKSRRLLQPDSDAVECNRDAVGPRAAS